jgi:purine-nucleoside phosphorylase
MTTVKTITPDISQMVESVRQKIYVVPRTAVVLGSGLGQFAKSIEDAVRIPYSEIPGYPLSGVEGHAGELVAGNVGHVPVLLASGRFHLYEGYDIDTVTLPVRLFHDLGIENLIITNAAGSTNRDFPPVTLMAAVGHLDCTFRESAQMPEVERGSDCHSPELLKLALEVAKSEQVTLERGVYAWALGPSYETPAEVQMIQELGGDAVGMSTVPEIRLAGKLGMRVLTISCLTNFAAGISKQPLTHDEVMETADRISGDFARLVRGIILAL